MRLSTFFLLAAVTACNARPADDTAAPPARSPVALAGKDLPSECGAYAAMIEKLASCEAMRPSAREALRRGYVAISRSWPQVATVSAEAKRAIADRCTQGLDATRQTASTICGW